MGDIDFREATDSWWRGEAEESWDKYGEVEPDWA
jgi:hypothetical protein